jgi:hypothetical protein
MTIAGGQEDGQAEVGLLEQRQGCAPNAVAITAGASAFIQLNARRPSADASVEIR